MTKLQFSSQWKQVFFVVALFGLDRLAAQIWGVSLLPGLGAEAGMLGLLFAGHCDTRDGPVVMLGKKALAEKNVNLVLPWVRSEDEAQIRYVFEHAQAVRELGSQAQSLADEHFLETLVRVHRAGEGAPYTGLKPAGLDIGPAVPAADQALQNGSPDNLLKLLVDGVTQGVRQRFEAARQKRAFDPNDVSAGREYVEAYVSYVHCVEKIWKAASVSAPVSQCGGHHRSGASGAPHSCG